MYSTPETIRQQYGLSDYSEVAARIIQLQLEQQEIDSAAEVEAIMPELMNQLSLANAPYTGRETACVIKTTEGTYGGRINERAPDDFETAEAMALSKIPETDSEIISIFVTGQGPIKPKHAMPSPASYDMIRNRFGIPAESGRGYSQVTLNLINPNTYNGFTRLDFYDLLAAYAPRDRWDFGDGGRYGAYIDALEYTLVDEVDAMFLGELHELGLTEDVEFYLTGSAAQGGVSSVINNGYEDLDIIAVTQNDKQDIEDMVLVIAENYYGPMKRVSKTVTAWPSGDKVKGTYFTNEAKMIDFFVGRSLKAVLLRPENLTRNFFHKIS